MKHLVPSAFGLPILGTAPLAPPQDFFSNLPSPSPLVFVATSSAPNPVQGGADAYWQAYKSYSSQSAFSNDHETIRQ
jgi:hypothetical protein